MTTCRSCARLLPPGARFCPHCGSPAAPAAAEERRIVSILFCDLTDSSGLSGLLDAELLRAILLRYFALMREQVEARGGVVEKFIGDAVMAVFGLVAREDDARRALSAALAMLDALAGLNAQLAREHGPRLEIRIGVHTGEVVTGATPADGQGLVSGEAVNVAARLQQAAAPGQVLASAAAWRAAGSAPDVVSVGALALKGIGRPVEAVRLLAVPASAPDAARRFDVPFVGRERDLNALNLVWGRVVEHGAAQALILLGEAGIGKTRLLAEWLERRGASAGTVLGGRCHSLGAGSLAALADCVAPLISGIDDGTSRPGPAVAAAVALLRGGLLLDGAPSPSKEKTCAALACVLGAAAARRPVLLTLDDFHAADPLLVEVLGWLLEDLARSPVMVLCLARPELIEAFPDWVPGRTGATTLVLAALSTDESARLAAGLADVAAHAAGTMERIVTQADGNPFYLEQLAAAAGEAGGDPQQLPPTLHTLLAARIDRLDDAERTVLRCAAVIGGEFTQDDLRSLTHGADVAAILRTLTRRRFIAPVPGPPAADAVYEFADIVMARVAYEGLTKRDRSQLHEHHANCLVAKQASDALVGEHLERAYRFHAEISVHDERTARLRERAASHLAHAGSVALSRMDLSRARSLLSRAVELTVPGEPQRPEFLQQLGAAYLTMGHAEEAESALRQAAAEAESQQLVAVAAHARLLLAGLRPDGAQHVAAVESSLPLSPTGDEHLGFARNRLILARSFQRRGRHTEALSILDGTLGHAARAAPGWELAATLGAIGMSLWFGPEPVPSAIERCEGLLAVHGPGNDAVRATLGFPLTVLYALHADATRSAACLAETQQAMSAGPPAEARVLRPLLSALVAVALDEPRTARATLRDALGAARDAPRGTGLLHAISVELARLELARARWRAAADLVEGLTAGEDCAEQAGHLGIRAWISAYTGGAEAVRRFGDQAEAAAGETDSTVVQALVLLDRAHGEAVLGLCDEACRHAIRAHRLAAAKGDSAGVLRAERLLTGASADRRIAKPDGTDEEPRARP